MKQYKRLYHALYLTMIMSLAVTVFFIIKSPDVVPAHYGFDGKITRFGSKYEFLLFPFFSILMGVFFHFTAVLERKKEKGSNEAAMLITGIFIVVLFTLMGTVFMVMASSYKGASAVTSKRADFDLLKILSVGTGLLLLLAGILMPKLKTNSLVGVRTSWSMVNEEVWEKSQKAGGIMAIITGFMIIITTAPMKSGNSMIFTTSAIAIWAIASIIASYRIFKKYKKDHPY